MNWDSVQTWLLGGGLTGVLVFAMRANAQLRAFKVEQAKMAAETAAQKAKEAQFEASISESSTKVAGEGILRGLLITLTQREQEAHQATALVMQQLTESREINAGFREDIAELREKEEQCQVTVRTLQTSINTMEINHRDQIRALNNRIYDMSSRLRAAGGMFSATDVAPNHDPADR